MMTDPEDQKTVFDLLEIIIAEEVLSARPIEFAFDEEENPVSATKYETTCPRCSQLVQFGTDEILVDIEDNYYVQGCDDCPVNAVFIEPKEAPAPMEMESAIEDGIEGADFDTILNDDAFSDPIASGKMKTGEGTKKLN